MPPWTSRIAWFAAFLVMLLLALVIALELVSVLGAPSRMAHAKPLPSSSESLPADLGVPIWGCEGDPLPDGGVHLVVSGVIPRGSWEQWLPHVGLTNAHAFIYFRVGKEGDDQAGTGGRPGLVSINPLRTSVGSRATQALPKVKLPCGMKLFFKLLLPNRARESAVFFSHVLQHYSNLPRAIALLHDHGPLSHHSMCGPWYRRLRGYYRGLQKGDWDSESRLTSKIVTLNGGCNAVTAVWQLGNMPADNCCMVRG